MYNEVVEREVLAKLREHEQAKQAAQRRITTAEAEVEEANQAIEAYRFVLNDYRKQAGISPMAFEHSSVLEAAFKHLGPTELVDYWARRHGGDVVVKDLTKAALAAGKFKKYRNAYSAITSVVKRKKYEYVGEGHYRKRSNGKEIFHSLMEPT